MEFKHLCFGFAAIILSLPLQARADRIADLHSPDMTVRRQAIDAVQTMDDPRIPAACLPLLHDEGYSIRRQAARAIGSRFSQIPVGDRGPYVKELKGCAATGPADVTLMCERAIGLLTQNYAFPSFSVSPNGKWVLYERRRLPVIANIAEQQHELLSPYDPMTAGGEDTPYYSGNDEGNGSVSSGLLKLVVTNESAADLFAPHWQPGGNAIAFTLETLERRFYHPILVWSASHPDVQVLNFERFQPLLGQRQHEWGTTTEFAGWKDNKVLVRIFDYLPDDDTGQKHSNEATVSYDIKTGDIARER